MKKHKVRVTVTLTAEVLKKVDALAKNDHRSRSGMIEAILQEETQTLENLSGN